MTGGALFKRRSLEDRPGINSHHCHGSNYKGYECERHPKTGNPYDLLQAISPRSSGPVLDVTAPGPRGSAELYEELEP